MYFMPMGSSVLIIYSYHVELKLKDAKATKIVKCLVKECNKIK